MDYVINFPDYTTREESLDELRENLIDLYDDIVNIKELGIRK